MSHPSFRPGSDDDIVPGLPPTIDEIREVTEAQRQIGRINPSVCGLRPAYQIDEHYAMRRALIDFEARWAAERREYERRLQAQEEKYAEEIRKLLEELHVLRGLLRQRVAENAQVGRSMIKYLETLRLYRGAPDVSDLLDLLKSRYE